MVTLAPSAKAALAVAKPKPDVPPRKITCRSVIKGISPRPNLEGLNSLSAPWSRDRYLPSTADNQIWKSSDPLAAIG
jgi:hypothetical protein